VSNENQHKLLTMRPTVLGVLFSFFIFSSCNEEPGIQNQEALAAQPLTGTWEWIRTTGGIGAQIYETPSSMEKTVEWRFLHDMKYLRYENGVIQSQGTFSLTKKACIHSTQEKWFIDFSADLDQDFMIEKLEDKTLETSDEVYDGVSSQFKRKLTD
jgi:hypothetical protein